MSGTPRLAIGVWLAVVLACAFIISRTEFHADLSAFLPRSPTPAQQVLVEQLRDGVVSRLILIGIEGDAPPALAQTSKRLAGRLRQQAGIATVNNGEDTGAEEDREFLWRNRYLLSPAVTPGHFSAASLRRALEENLQLLGSPAGALLQRTLPNDPTGELLRLIEQFAGQARPEARHGVWFSGNGERALLVVQIRAAGFDIDAQEHVLASIRRDFAHAAEGAGTQKLLLSGSGVFAVNSRENITGDAWRFSLIATALVAAMLLALYRSPRVLALGLLPVASGALAGVAAVSVSFGAVHGITLAFGATLIGEGVDYAIYLFTRIAPGETARVTLNRIWRPLRLGVLTSVCGFGVMLFSGFPGLAQLGLFSIAGLIVAAAVTRWVLPAMLAPGFAARTVSTIAPRLSALVRQAPAWRIPLAVLTLSALLFLALREGPLWNDNLGSLSPVPLGAQNLDGELRKDLGAPDLRYMVIATATSEEQALEASEKMAVVLAALQKRGALQGYDSPAAYLPSLTAQRARQAALPVPDELRENLRQALHGLPFRPGLFEAFLADVATARHQSLLDRASLQPTSLALKLDSLLVKRSAGWSAMLPLRGVTDAQAIGREIAQFSGTSVGLLDMKSDSEQLFRTYRQNVVTHSLAGVAAIAVLLLASLQSVRRVLGVMTPLAAAVVVTAAILVLGADKLSMFHLIGLLLVVAVGSNYALFFDQQAASNHDWERTLVSLLFANLCAVIGFGVLSFSKVPVLHAIGSSVGIGAILSLVFSAILITRVQNGTAVQQ
ncbi:MAG: MMPL family transporter [Betaproteobacteria bacterium]